MKKIYGPLFWSLLILFIFTNLFWVYQVIDSAVSHSYSQDICKEFQKDSDNLKKITHKLQTQTETLDFVKEYNLKTDTLHKGKDFYINFGSFNIGFDKNKNRLKE